MLRCWKGEQASSGPAGRGLHPGPASLTGRRAQRWDVGSQGDSTGVNVAVLGHNSEKKKGTRVRML